MKKFLFNTTAFFAPVDTVARAALRAQIPVTVVKGDGKPKDEGEEEVVAAEDNKSGDEVGTNEEGNNNEVDDEGGEKGDEGDHQQQLNDNKGEIKENKEEIKEAKEALEAATTQKEKDRAQKRIDRLTAKNDSLTKENAELKRQLAAKPKEGLTEEEIEVRSTKKAEEKDAQRQWANDVDKLFKAAVKVDKDFKKKIDTVVEELGGVEQYGIPPVMIGFLSDIDNAGEVLVHLADDIDLYEEVRALPMTKMANRLNKISNQLEKEAEETAKKAKEAKAPKEPSKVPEPVQPIRGNNNSPGIYTKNMSMDDYAAMRHQQKADRAKRKAAGLR